MGRTFFKANAVSFAKQLRLVGRMKRFYACLTARALEAALCTSQELEYD